MSIDLLALKGLSSARRAVAAACAGALSMAAGSAQADTLAYWNFEDGAEGVELQATFGNASTFTADVSGSGNPLQVFNTVGAPETSPFYSENVALPVVPQTGSPNTLAMFFDGNDDLYTQDNAPINQLTSISAITIEATVQFGFTGAFAGYQTFVGKDGGDFAGTSDPALAPAYFQLVQDPGLTNHVAIKLRQGNGEMVSVYTQQPVTQNQYYSFAAVMGGGTLSLYQIIDGVATLENSAAFDGPFISQNRVWTIGRGMYNNQVGDFLTEGSFVDEVRISDVALSPSEFLQVGNTSVFVEGDADSDGDVDFDDLGILLGNYDQSGFPTFTQGDSDGDGDVDFDDLGLLLGNYGFGTEAPTGQLDAQAISAVRAAGLTAVVPEPSMISVLALAGVGLTRRRRA